MKQEGRVHTRGLVRFFYTNDNTTKRAIVSAGKGEVKMATIYGLGSKRDARHPTSHIVQQRTFDFDDEVVVMSFGQWVEVCDDFGTTPTYFPWHLRQADICLNGLWIRSGDIGRKLQSGNAVFEAIEAVTPNAKLDSIRVGLADVLSVDMRAGVLCRVIQSGEVVLGQSAVFV